MRPKCLYLTIYSSIISGDSATIGGGGICNNSRYYSPNWIPYQGLRIVSSTISENKVSGNFAYSYGGGGIYNGRVGVNTSANMIIISSTISNNKVTGKYNGIGGGGIYNGGYECWVNATIISSTISNNKVIGDSVGVGGGIYNGINGDEGGGADLNIISSTISNNQATKKGGGLYNHGVIGFMDAIATSYILNTIIINNKGLSGANIFNENNYSYSYIYAYYSWYNQSSGNIIYTRKNAANDSSAYKSGDLDSLKLNPPGTTATMATNYGCPAIGKATFAYYNPKNGYYFLDSNNVSHRLTNWDTSTTINPAEKITNDQRGVYRNSPPTIGAYQDINSAINELKVENGGLRVWPNPASEMLNVECSMLNRGNIKIEVYDVMGKKVKELGIRNYELGINGEQRVKVDVGDLGRGVYFIKFQVSGSKFQGEKVGKFVKL